MQVKNGALHQRTSSDGAALYPTVPSKKGSYSKTVTSCRQCKGDASRLVLEHSREKDTSETAKKKRENRTFYIRGHALERFIVTSSQRGVQFRWRVFRSNSFQSVFH